MAVRFSTAIDPSDRSQGTVRFIGPSVRTSSRDLVVEALVPNPDHSLRPGEFVLARLVLGDSRCPPVPQDRAASRRAARGASTWSRRRRRNLEERLVEIGETQGRSGGHRQAGSSRARRW